MARQDFWYNPQAKEAGLPPIGCKGAGFIWLSAQTAVDLETGAITRDIDDLPKEGDEQLRTGRLNWDLRPKASLRAQTWRIYDNLRRILAQQGASLNDIVQQRIYLRNIRTAQVIEEQMLVFFPDYKPATLIWRMNDRGLNDDILIQVEAFAVDPKSGLQKEAVYIPELARLTAPYPQAVKVGQFLFSSAIYGIDPATGQVPMCRADLPEDIPQAWSDNYYSDAVNETAKAQVALIINNIDRLMTSQGATINDVGYIHQWMGAGRIGFSGVIRFRNIHWTDPMISPTPTGFVMERITADPRIKWGIEIIGLLPGPIRREPAVVPDRVLGYGFPSHCKMGPLWVMGGEIPGDITIRKSYSEFSELPDAGRFLAQGRNHPHRTMVQAWFLYQTILKRVLRDAGLDFSKVVLQRIYMWDVSQYPDVERIALLAFDGKLPPTSVIPVDDPTAFEGARVEIEFVCDTT